MEKPGEQAGRELDDELEHLEESRAFHGPSGTRISRHGKEPQQAGIDAVQQAQQQGAGMGRRTGIVLPAGAPQSQQGQDSGRANADKHHQHPQDRTGEVAFRIIVRMGRCQKVMEHRQRDDGERQQEIGCQEQPGKIACPLFLRGRPAGSEAFPARRHAAIARALVV